MKLSVSLPDEDVEYLDRYASSQGYKSRSAVEHKAVRLLRASELGGAYESAWQDWDGSDEAASWDAAVGDGLSAP